MKNLHEAIQAPSSADAERLSNQNIPDDPRLAERNTSYSTFHPLPTEGGKTGKDEPDRDGKEKNETRSRLPAQLATAFEDHDLSDVEVVTNSRLAQEQGATAFAVGGHEIHLAGTDLDPHLLRHELLHVVQQRKGRVAKANGQQPQAPGTNTEKEAQAAELDKGGPRSGAALTAADPDKPQYDGGAPSRGRTIENTGSAAPAFMFHGTEFRGVQGNKDWWFPGMWYPGPGDSQMRTVAQVRTFLRFPPPFCIGGIDVRAGVDFQAGIAPRGTVQYAWDRQAGTVALSGQLAIDKRVTLRGFVRGSLGLDAVIQSGGVGLEAALTAALSQTAAVQLSGELNNFDHSGRVPVPRGGNLRLTFPIDLSASLEAALAVVAFTEGWFSNKTWRWDIARWPLMRLVGYSVEGAGLQYDFRSGRLGAIPSSDVNVRVGQVIWGNPPQMTENNGRAAR
jgi:hypothetical protein